MLKFRNVIWGVLCLLLAVNLVFTIFIFFGTEESKTVFVDNNKLYEDFLLKQELEQDLLTIKQLRQNTIDSLKVEMELVARKAGQNPSPELLQSYKGLQEEYIGRRSQFEEEIERIISNYDTRIWNQLNTYVKEYGENRGYEFILGTSGLGSLMYADSVKDVTGEVVAYCNNRYKGINE